MTHAFVLPGVSCRDLQVAPGWTRHEPSRLLVRVDGDRVRVRRKTTSGVVVTWDGTLADTPEGLRLSGRVRDPGGLTLAVVLGTGAVLLAGLLVLLLVEGAGAGASAGTAVAVLVLGGLSWWLVRRLPGDAAAHQVATEHLLAALCGVSPDIGLARD